MRIAVLLFVIVLSGLVSYIGRGIAEIVFSLTRFSVPLIPNTRCWARSMPVQHICCLEVWGGDANLLRESLEAVQQAAAVILGGIAPEPAALASAEIASTPKKQ
jgi:hypothetical protein